MPFASAARALGGEGDRAAFRVDHPDHLDLHGQPRIPAHVDPCQVAKRGDELTLLEAALVEAQQVGHEPAEPGVVRTGDHFQRLGIEDADGRLGQKAGERIVDRRVRKGVRRLRLPLLVPAAAAGEEQQRRDKRASSEPHRASTIASPPSVVIVGARSLTIP